MFILHHNESRSCALLSWTQQEIPTLQFNQVARANLKNHYNHHSLSLVCICKDSDTILLDSLAKDVDGMRLERVILWIEINVSQELLRVITNQTEKHGFLQLIIIEAMDHLQQNLPVFRLHCFPSHHFHRIENIFNLKGPIFPYQRNNFRGKTATVEAAGKTGLKSYVWMSPELRVPIDRTEDNIVPDFANRYNLSLKVISVNNNSSLRTSDFQLSSLFRKNRYIKYISPYDISSIIVVVPCGRDMQIEEVFRHLDVRSWLLRILLVYGIFVLAETFILVVTHRISGKAYRLTSVNPVLNLRAFRALLGMSFPISRRSSLSLRQLFLVISVFGFVFSNFFNCKLSSMLTKHSHHSQVNTFHDLRSSGLTVLVDPNIRFLIESRLGPDFFTQNITRVKFTTQKEKVEFMLSLDSTYAYVLLLEKWDSLRDYQKFFDKKVFCTSKDLTIIQGIPRTYTEQNNSIYYWPLFLFSLKLQEAGIIGHWTQRAPFKIRPTLNISIVNNAEQSIEALKFNHLNWLWSILGCGHGLAIFVFIVEICIGGHHRRNWNLRSRNHIFVV